MSVSRKDFEQVAAVLAGDLSTAQNGGERLKVRAITLSLADVFARSNPRFNRGRFYRAAGLTDRRALISRLSSGDSFGRQRSSSRLSRLTIHSWLMISSDCGR